MLLSMCRMCRTGSVGAVYFFFPLLDRFSMQSWTRSTTANLRTAPPQKSWRRCSRNSTACHIRPTRYVHVCLSLHYLTYGHWVHFFWVDRLLNIISRDLLQSSGVDDNLGKVVSMTLVSMPRWSRHRDSTLRRGLSTLISLSSFLSFLFFCGFISFTQAQQHLRD